MAWLSDLTPCDYLPVSAAHILAVGWLENGNPFPVGATTSEVFKRLQEFSHEPWQPFVSAGVHECNLCQFRGEQAGGANIFIPRGGKIYVCPALIVHYINAHHYQPPVEFCEAVLACPAMNSIQYKRQLIASNGEVLWKAPS